MIPVTESSYVDWTNIEKKPTNIHQQSFMEGWGTSLLHRFIKEPFVLRKIEITLKPNYSCNKNANQPLLCAYPAQSYEWLDKVSSVFGDS